MKRTALARKTSLRRTRSKPQRVAKKKPTRRKRFGGIKRTAADAKFSTFIRERDNWTCMRCGKRYDPPTRALHCAHCFTRGSKATRHDPTNAQAACYGCHVIWDSHPEEKYEAFRKRFGVEEFDALRRRSNLSA